MAARLTVALLAHRLASLAIAGFGDAVVVVDNYGRFCAVQEVETPEDGSKDRVYFMGAEVEG